ncbi:MAG: Ig-like domain-containing protein [Candidatus Woesearchaeota archaeon]
MKPAVCLFVFLLLIPSVFSAVYTNKERPSLNVTFNEPVTIVSVKLLPGVSVDLLKNISNRIFVYEPRQSLAQGIYTLQVVAKDFFGNKAEYQENFVVDFTPPSISLSIGENALIRQKALLVSFSLSEPVNTTYVELNKRSVIDKFSAINLTYSALLQLQDGDSSFYVFASDLAGNSNSILRRFSSITGPIQFAMVSPRYGVAKEQPFDFVFSTSRWADCRYADEPLNYSQMAKNVQTVNHTIHKIASVPSAQTVYVSCIDQYGVAENNSKFFSLTVDSEDPSILSSAAQPSRVEDEPETLLVVTTDEPTKCRYSAAAEDFDDMTEFKDSFNHTNRISVATPSVNGDYSFTVQCEDKSERKSQRVTIHYTVYLGFGLQIYDHTNEFFHTTAPYVNFSTSKRSQCYISNDSSRPTKSFVGSGTSFLKTLYLSPGSFTYYVYCYTVGNSSQSRKKTVSFTIDLTPPMIIYVNDSNPELSSNPEYTYRLDRIFASWLALDNETGIESYLVQVVSDDFLSSLMVFNKTMSERSGWLYGSLNNSKKYYIKVRALNKAKMWSNELSSNGITVNSMLLPDSCKNNVKDSSETDIDCGGSICARCASGKHCLKNLDCTNDFCDVDYKCSIATCNNNGMAESGEACDTSDLNGKLCANFDSFSSGALACNKHCDFDTASCLVCDNDGRADSGEPCDGSELRQKSCKFFGFTGGSLGCDSNCQFVFNSCNGYSCNQNNKAESGEVCDSIDLRSRTCQGFANFTGGKLSCTDDCELDFAGCTTCDNDNRAENGEACDGTDLRSRACKDFDGFGTGILACKNCDFVTQGCIVEQLSSCLDDIKNGFETDVDCGGSCPKCPDGNACKSNSDCSSGHCDISRLRCAADHCSNGKLDPGEPDVDCGGSCPARCSIGLNCDYPEDCSSGLTCFENVCIEQASDSDADSIDDKLDNCPADYNPDQLDSDKDGSGDVCDEDNDNDGMPDSWETQNSLNPLDPADAIMDNDNDGLTNLEEYNHLTDPSNSDTDYDGWTDKQEVDKGTDPLDPSSHPKSVWLTVLLAVLIICLFGVGGYFGYIKFQDYRKSKPAAFTGIASSSLLKPFRPIVQQLQRFTRPRIDKSKIRAKAFESFKQSEPKVEAKVETPKPKQPLPSADEYVPIEQVQEKARKEAILSKIKKKEVFGRLGNLSKGKEDVMQKLSKLAESRKGAKDSQKRQQK